MAKFHHLTWLIQRFYAKIASKTRSLGPSPAIFLKTINFYFPRRARGMCIEISDGAHRGRKKTQNAKSNLAVKTENFHSSPLCWRVFARVVLSSKKLDEHKTRALLDRSLKIINIRRARERASGVTKIRSARRGWRKKSKVGCVCAPKKYRHCLPSGGHVTHVRARRIRVIR